MHNNYYFLRQLSAQLNSKLAGYSVVSCFSQNKDELVIECNNGRDSFFIKASLSPALSSLSFPPQFHRARKNSIDLFNRIILKKIIHVRQFANERSFLMEMEDSCALLFKMHGNFANVLLIERGAVTEIFRSSLKADYDTQLESLDKVIDFSKENFLAHISLLSKTYFTLGKSVWDFLSRKNFDQADDERKWSLFQETIHLLEQPSYYLIKRNGGLTFSLLPFDNAELLPADPVVAITSFFDRSMREAFLSQEKNTALHQLQAKLKATESYVKKNTEKLNDLIHDTHYQLWADLVMANMNAIAQGQEKIELTSFYDNSPVTIKLKKELSPQKNAEVFYRKAKNQQIEISKLKESIAQKEKEMVVLRKRIEAVTATQDLKAIRTQAEEAGLTKKDSPQFENLPYHEFEFKGFRIWVGRNAEANDELTQKHSYKEDLWLHAKDVAGSHVIIKHQSGKNFPKDVIEYAAGLAAFNSKRKNDSLCPVAVTPKKFVRKRKGDPAGMVVVEREEVILVEPIKVNR
ncbi:MAG: DUF814 domain-containing protein [Bacteroidetes bacterium]|nr:DUF814 domain-containing protein [Bacteroidota bacterium]